MVGIQTDLLADEDANDWSLCQLYISDHQTPYSTQQSAKFNSFTTGVHSDLGYQRLKNLKSSPPVFNPPPTSTPHQYISPITITAGCKQPKLSEALRLHSQAKHKNYN